MGVDNEGAVEVEEREGGEPSGGEAAPKDLHSTLTAAFEKHEAELTKPDSATERPAEIQKPEPKGDRTRDEAGRFAKGKPAAGASTGEAADPAGGAQEEKPPAPSPTLKAPQSWKPTAREKFNALPQDVQEEVLRIDREVRKTMQESASARQTAIEWQRTVAPFEAMIRAEGAEPVKAVGELLRTAAALRSAPAGHKAQLVASMISTFGIDPAAVAAHLAGTAPPAQPQPQPRQQEFRDPRLDQFFQERQTQMAERIETELQEFSQTHDFMEDVAPRLSVLLKTAAEQRIPISLEEAYNAAIAMDPELSAVVKQREAAKASNVQKASTERARAASSSIKGSPAGGSSTPPKPKGMRAQLEAAFDEAEAGSR